MNFEKADYRTIVEFGTLKDFKEKIRSKGDSIVNIVDLVDKQGISLLERSLISKKWEISKYLLDNGAKVNVVSGDGCNEFHYIAANINNGGALEIGRILLEKGTSVMQKDKKYGNTAFFTLCIEAFKKRSTDVMGFIEECFEGVTDVDEENNRGISIRKLLDDRGNEKLKKMLKERYTG